jgi:hypothetical protein
MTDETNLAAIKDIIEKGEAAIPADSSQNDLSKLQAQYVELQDKHNVLSEEFQLFRNEMRYKTAQKSMGTNGPVVDKDNAGGIRVAFAKLENRIVAIENFALGIKYNEFEQKILESIREEVVKAYLQIKAKSTLIGKIKTFILVKIKRVDEAKNSAIAFLIKKWW